MALDAVLSGCATLSLSAILLALPSCYASHEPETPHTGPCYVRAWVCDGPYSGGDTPGNSRPVRCSSEDRDELGADCRGWFLGVFAEDGEVYSGGVSYSHRRRRALLTVLHDRQTWALEGDHLVIEQVSRDGFYAVGTRTNLPLEGCSGDEFTGLGRFMNDFTGFNVRFPDCVDRVPELQDGIMDAVTHYQDGGVVFDY